MATTTLPDEILDLIADRFRALAEPTRLRILQVLLHDERTVSELVEETGLQQANVSKHLGILRGVGFVERRKDRGFTFYRIADDSVATLCDIMCGRLEAIAEERSALLASQ